jgi:hypothetical protein
MKIETRIVFFINQLKVYLNRRIFFFKEVFSFALFTLFVGFLIGNLFGTFLNTIRYFIFWDGLIIFIILSIMELLNFILYNKAKRFFVISQKISYYPNNQIIWKSLNYLKIGIMFGFFIDAFKVGS